MSQPPEWLKGGQRRRRPPRLSVACTTCRLEAAEERDVRSILESALMSAIKVAVAEKEMSKHGVGTTGQTSNRVAQMLD